MQARAGRLDVFMAENAEMIVASAHVLESTVISTYKAWASYILLINTYGL